MRVLKLVTTAAAASSGVAAFGSVGSTEVAIVGRDLNVLQLSQAIDAELAKYGTPKEATEIRAAMGVPINLIDDKDDKSRSLLTKALDTILKKSDTQKLNNGIDAALRPISNIFSKGVFSRDVAADQATDDVSVTLENAKAVAGAVVRAPENSKLYSKVIGLKNDSCNCKKLFDRIYRYAVNRYEHKHGVQTFVDEVYLFQNQECSQYCAKEITPIFLRPKGVSKVGKNVKLVPASPVIEKPVPVVSAPVEPTLVVVKREEPKDEDDDDAEDEDATRDLTPVREPTTTAKPASSPTDAPKKCECNDQSSRFKASICKYKCFLSNPLPNPLPKLSEHLRKWSWWFGQKPKPKPKNDQPEPPKERTADTCDCKLVGDILSHQYKAWAHPKAWFLPKKFADFNDWECVKPCQQLWATDAKEEKEEKKPEKRSLVARDQDRDIETGDLHIIPEAPAPANVTLETAEDKKNTLLSYRDWWIKTKKSGKHCTCSLKRSHPVWEWIHKVLFPSSPRCRKFCKDVVKPWLEQEEKVKAAVLETPKPHVIRSVRDSPES